MGSPTTVGGRVIQMPQDLTGQERDYLMPAYKDSQQRIFEVTRATCHEMEPRQPG